MLATLFKKLYFLYYQLSMYGVNWGKTTPLYGEQKYQPLQNF